MKTVFRATIGRSSHPERVSDEQVAGEILGFLASSPDHLLALLTQTGLDPAALRRETIEPSVRRGLFDFVLGDEALLIAIATSTIRSPESFARAIMERPIDQP